MSAPAAPTRTPSKLTDANDLIGKVKGGRKFYLQLLVMQDALFASSLDPETGPGERASCARAWEVLEERKRIMRGRPLPGSFKPDQPRKAKQAGATVVYPSPGPASAPAVVNDDKPAA